jgi:hypothetical protein
MIVEELATVEVGETCEEDAELELFFREARPPATPPPTAPATTINATAIAIQKHRFDKPHMRVGAGPIASGSCYVSSTLTGVYDGY